MQWRVRADGSSITQREAHLDVLRDCLDAMMSGLRILDGAGHLAAAHARTAQILRMDLPRLVSIGRTHPDDAYRRALGGFARELWALAGAAASELDEQTAASVAAARLW